MRVWIWRCVIEQQYETGQSHMAHSAGLYVRSTPSSAKVRCRVYAEAYA